MSRGAGGGYVVLANSVDGGAHAGSSSIVRTFGQMTVSPMPPRPEVTAASAAADPAANVTARRVVLANCVDGGAHAGSSSIVRASGQMTVSPIPQRPEVAAASAAADPAANVAAAARCVVLATDSVVNAAKAIVRQDSSMPRRAQSSRPADRLANRLANRLSRRADPMADPRGLIAKRSQRNSTLVGLYMAAHLEHCRRTGTVHFSCEEQTEQAQQQKQQQQMALKGLKLHLTPQLLDRLMKLPPILQETILMFPLQHQLQILQLDQLLPLWQLHQLHHNMGDLTVTEG